MRELLDKYIDSNVSNSSKIHSNSEMSKAIIETFKSTVEDIRQLIENNKDKIDDSVYSSVRIEHIIEQYYTEQLNK